VPTIATFFATLARTEVRVPKHFETFQLFGTGTLVPAVATSSPLSARTEVRVPKHFETFQLFGTGTLVISIYTNIFYLKACYLGVYRRYLL